MMSKPDLLVASCSYEAAKYAVMRWHYSRSIPAGKLVKFGAWEDKEFIGCVLFGRGANNNIGSPYGLDMTEVCELTRVAFGNHISPISQIVMRAINLLRSQSINLRLIVSYADPEQDHIGTVYQAMNWVYTGTSRPQRFTLGPGGAIVHKRSAFAKFGTVKNQKYSKILWKHKYLYPLDRAMRRQIAPLAQPYPKRNDVRPVNGDISATSGAGRFDPDPDA